MGNKNKYLLGQILNNGYVALDVESILCVFKASKITFVPTFKEHLLGILTWEEAVCPVIDLAVSRPPHFDYRARGAVAVALKCNTKAAPLLAVFLEQTLSLRDSSTMHFNWGDKFNLKRTFYFTECFSMKLEETIDGIIIPVLEVEKVIDSFKNSSYGSIGGKKWQKPIQEQSVLL